ncbi:glycoside hydrolase family 32 protein [Herbiconiux sp. L3-i23]|uniref:glycoside hydrolase family 32 protein n=1 Tax=Herbiconiux sp. L3-i23 TaxID=2905871 RepID=UPI00206D4BD3|nr:glycoside hydrolase family 32 protein [Herbiconiux sp. L3-i23]BDI23425.1 hypothetical protein L3i23_22010 [Herbiconiux sp. L3-i23]
MRPEFHFTARSGWINDPHGTTVKDGEYHSFFQYVPGSTVWAPNCHWGHAKGPDLLSLTELPVAIYPGDGDGGIWTGSLVTAEEGARILYTSTSEPDLGAGRIRIAEPAEEDWVEWRKGDFVADAPAGVDLVAYRDPFVVKEGERWRMFVGAGAPDGTAMALTYTSPDLHDWTYDGVALERSTNDRDPVWMGALWECPQIIEVDGRHVMVSSVWDDDVLYYAGYAVGRYADGRFTAESWGQLTFGPSYYAPSFFRDADGRPCLTFWMRGVSDLEAGWASAHSVPHLLSLRGDALVATPHPDVEKYRTEAVVDGGLPGLAGDVTWAAREGDRLIVRAGSDEALQLIAEEGRVDVRTAAGSWGLPFTGGEVRLILDAQAVEVSTPEGVLGVALQSKADRYSVDASGAVVRPLAR